MLLIFLPPLLYGAAFFTSLRDLRRNARPIALLSIGVVLVTMVAVAVVAHEAIGLGWAEAFVLGAIVSPTDAVAPAEILRRMGAPRRLLTVIEGENLTNDWTALVLYKFAVAAVVSGSFSLAEAGLKFVWSGVGGLLIGLVAGLLIREVRRRIDDPPTEITISLLSGYAAYLPAEELGVSGVIAAVTVGIYMGWHTPELTTPVMRLQGVAIWEVLTFLLNALLFLLVGLQLPTVIDGISGHTTGELIGWGVLVSAVVIGVRLIWQFTVVYVDPRDRPARGPARAARRLAPAAGRRLGRDARVGVAGGGAGAAAAHRRRRALPGARPDHLPDLRGDAGDAGRPGADAGAADPAARRSRTTAPRSARRSPPGSGWRRRRSRAIEELGEDWVRDDTLERVRGLYDYRRRRFGERGRRRRATRSAAAPTSG